MELKCLFYSGKVFVIECLWPAEIQFTGSGPVENKRSDKTKRN